MDILLIVVIIIGVIVLWKNKELRVKAFARCRGLLRRITGGAPEGKDGNSTGGQSGYKTQSRDGSVNVNRGELSVLTSRIEALEREVQWLRNQGSTSGGDISTEMYAALVPLQSKLKALTKRVDTVESKMHDIAYTPAPAPAPAPDLAPQPASTPDQNVVRYSYTPEGKGFAESDMSNTPENMLFEIVQRSQTEADFYLAPTDYAKKEIFRNLMYYLEWVDYTDESAGTRATTLDVTSSGRLVLTNGVWMVAKKIGVVLR